MRLWFLLPSRRSTRRKYKSAWPAGPESSAAAACSSARRGRSENHIDGNDKWRYNKDKEKSSITDGKYSLTSLYKDGNELKYLGEFNIENGNLIHLCISDGTKKLDIESDNITIKYLTENAKFERSVKACEFSE